MSQLSGILYYSFARDGISDEALQNIVTRARARNRALSVTGQLHFENRLFLQWLEGEKAELNKIWDIVSADPQHSSLSLVFQGEIPKRYFPKWKMAHTNRKDALLLHYLQKRGLILSDKKEKLSEPLLEFLCNMAVASDRPIRSIRSLPDSHPIKDYYLLASAPSK